MVQINYDYYEDLARFFSRILNDLRRQVAKARPQVIGSIRRLSRQTTLTNKA